MTTIDDARARLRADLDDLDASAYRWTDQELERHINHALSELSDSMPRQLRSTLQTTPASREISIASLKPRLRVTHVEYPTGNYPPTYAQFSIWGDTLTLLTDSAPTTTADVHIYWHTTHVLDQAGSSLDGPQVDTLLEGAAGFAAEQLASHTTETISIGGPQVDQDYAALAKRKLAAFRAALKARGYRASLRPSRLYTPAEPAPTQDTDPGP